MLFSKSFDSAARTFFMCGRWCMHDTRSLPLAPRIRRNDQPLRILTAGQALISDQKTIITRGVRFQYVWEN